MNSSIKIKKVVMIGLPPDIVGWFSQTLMIQSLQSFWGALLKELRVSFQIINVHPSNLHLYKPSLKKADLIVFSWNGPIYLKSLREDLRVEAPTIHYLAGESSRGFSYSIGRADSLRQSDVFICVSTVEQKALRSCYPKAHSIVSPYPYLVQQEEGAFSQIPFRSNMTKLLYIGRFSEQKNLHTFLWSLRIILNQSPYIKFSVDFYGYEDKLGSPNMGMHHSNYQKYLKNLVKFFRLEEWVTWHGFIKNSVLKRFIQSTPHVLISPSLYSEECFGLAPIDSLIRGNYAVLTAWGGYRDLKRNFTRQVETIPVFKSKRGPHISPFILARLIRKQIAALQNDNEGIFNSPKPYRAKSIKNQIIRLMSNLPAKAECSRSLKKSKWLSSVHRQIIQLNPDLQKSLSTLKLRVYKNYEDPLAQKAFRIYGMTEMLIPFHKNLEDSKTCWIAPWIVVRKNIIRSVDPHRGTFLKAFRQSHRIPSIRVHHPFKQTIKLPSSIVKWLFERGYVFFDEPSL